MCGGGSAPRSTITVPDYSAYDRQFDLQKEAITNKISSNNLVMQQNLNAALKKQEDVKEKVKEIKVEKAEQQEDLEEQAQRLSVLMGPPPPEQVASAPEIGARERGINSRKGKQSLRIARTAASKSAQGTGLNIRT